MAPAIPIIGLLLALLGACGPTTEPTPSPAPAPEPDIEFVAGWSEADSPRDVLEAIGTPDRIVHDEAGLQELIEAASPALEVDALREVDMDEVVLVVASYPRCNEFSVVELAEGGAALRLHVVTDDGPIECVWAPLQVDVWSVERGDLVDEPRLIS